MKTFTHYRETKALLDFIVTSWPTYTIAQIQKIIADAADDIDERSQIRVGVQALFQDEEDVK